MEIKGDGMEETILNQLQEFMKSSPDSFTIIEEKIDIDLQMEYFKVSKRIKEGTLNAEEIIESSDLLYDSVVEDEAKRVLLNKLASIENVEAYRIIEHFYKSDLNTIKEWTALALRESKMMIETSLLEEKQILISTGLGGKGNKLRYFIVAISKGLDFNETQQKIIKSEFDFALQNHESSIETIDFDKKYAKIIALIPLSISVKETLNEAVHECNQFGDFLKDNFIVTNVKEFTSEEIDEFLTQKSIADKSNELPW